MTIIELSDELESVHQQIVQIAAQASLNSEWLSDKTINYLEEMHRACVHSCTSMKSDIQNGLIGELN